ncbi:TonB-dependent receptor plug domain-containing protein [Pseudodonghicola xiamenensis]|uniref:Ligand-gated channel n=1 Tax=Pseudodonghicola xiamenensis TaxID=337702 RepID=A0A8J3HAZ2_9RHOB|nr:TonB-dependent receptor [Pseudodonghicola xiamenensis]GHH02066.1 ligand-gated channel [Pseudodonghicola xiamenensis]
MKKFLATASALAVCAASPLLAQDAYELDEITVTANKSGEATPLNRTGATVEVITQEDLKNAGETTVAEYLAREPGITVSGNGGLGTSTSLRIRGLGDKYIKVLVNGIDVTDPSSPQIQYNWGNMTTDNIERIEILKGSSSALYGSRAVAGVVSITTLTRPEEPGQKTTMSVEGGSNDTWRGTATYGYSGSRGGLAIGIDRTITDGFSSSAGGTEKDGYQGTQLSFSADVMATETLKLGLTAYSLEARGHFDEFGSDGTPPYDEYTTTKTRAARAYGQLDLGAWQHQVSASYYKNDRISSSNGVDTPFKGKRKRVDYVGSYSVSDMLGLTFGTDWEEQSYDSGADTGKTRTTGVFGEVQYAATSALDLSGSVRYDHHSNFGDHVTGRLAAAYQLTGATTLRATAATGFRAPSLYELNNTLYGNPNLKPEESTSFELGIEHDFGVGRIIKATAFYTEIDDLIDFRSLYDDTGAWIGGRYQTIPGTSTSQGIELSGQWAINDQLGLYANYTYTDAEDANGDRLLRVPRNDVNIGLTADLAARWSGEVNVRYVADRPAEYGVEMKDYTVVNLGVAYAITDQAQAYLRVENLFDEEYQTAEGFNTQGQAVYVGLRASF